MNPRHTVTSGIVAAFVVVGTGFGMEKADALDGAYVVRGGPANSPQGVQFFQIVRVDADARPSRSSKPATA
jgi:hypothetical protein